MSGCRVAPGGMHLGHVYGCFHGFKSQVDGEYFFVLSDCGAGNAEQNLVDTAHAGIAAASIHQIPNAMFVRESKIRPYLYDIFHRLLDCSTVADLRSTHPRGDDMLSGKISPSVSEFLFPCHQASFMLGLQANIAVFNDDNKAFVNYARRLARRAAQRWQQAKPVVPLLIERDFGRLLGWNGNRMSKANDNVLLLASTHPKVWRFAQNFVRHYLVNPSPTLARPYEAMFPGFVDVLTGNEPDIEQRLGNFIWNSLAPYRAATAALSGANFSVDGHLAFSERRAIEVIRSHPWVLNLK